MSSIARLRRLEQLFESLYRADQMRVLKLDELRSQVVGRREALARALSSGNPCLLGFTGELLSDSVRQAARLAGIEEEVEQALRDAAPRKAQLERVRRQIKSARTERGRKAERAVIEDISVRPTDA